MKYWIVSVTFLDGTKEGVLFSDEKDARDAFNGVDEGSTLAVHWTENYGESGLPMNINEFDIDI